MVFGLDIPALLVIGERLGYTSPWLMLLLAEIELGMLAGQETLRKEMAGKKDGDDDEGVQIRTVSTADESLLQIGWAE